MGFSNMEVCPPAFLPAEALQLGPILSGSAGNAYMCVKWQVENHHNLILLGFSF